MDKLFRKRTEKSGSGGGVRRTLRRKDNSAARAPKPRSALPPSLNIDIRNSLIMPSMTERFSVLLPGLSAAPDTAIRDMLAQQRTRTGGPSLTVEEEELLFAELRGNAPSQMSFSQMTNISEWDGNPPPFESDWASTTGRGSLAGSASSPSMMTASGSDGHVSAQSPRSTGDRSMYLSPNEPTRSPSVMDRRRVLPGGSHGFSSNQSFRDNNYLAKVAKEKEELHPSPGSTRRRLYAAAHELPPIRDSAHSTLSSRSDAPSTVGPASNRAATPTAASVSTTPVASPPALPRASPVTLFSTLNRQVSASSQGNPQLERQVSSSRTAAAAMGSQSSLPLATSLDHPPSKPLGTSQQGNPLGISLDRQPSNHSNDSAGYLQRQGSHSSHTSTLDRQASTRSQPGAAVDRQNSTRSNGAAEEHSNGAEPHEPRTVPLRDEPGRVRTQPVGGAAPQQRQSLLMALSAAQTKRISLALMEIESQLGRQANDDGDDASENYVLLNEDDEEILQNDGETDAESSDDERTRGYAEDSASNVDQLPPFITTHIPTSPSIPLFPYPLAPPPVPPPNPTAPSAAAAITPPATTPSNRPVSLPASPRTHDLQAMQASQIAPPVAPAPSSDTSRLSCLSNGASPSLSVGNDVYDRDSSGTQYSEHDYALPALKPFRPQPVRHTPSPATLSSAGSTSNGSIPGYVPGQPRPVGSRKVSSASTASPPAVATQQLYGWSHQPTPLPSSATVVPVKAAAGNGVQLARSLSAQATQSNSNAGSRSDTPIAAPVQNSQSRIDPVSPAPASAPAARHHGSQSVSDLGTWRSTTATTSTRSTHSRKSSRHSPSSSKHSVSSVLSPIARVTAVDHDSGATAHLRNGSIPMTPKSVSTRKSNMTLSPSSASGRLARRPSHSSLSSTCSTSLEADDSAPWDAFLRQESPDAAALITPNDDQDQARADLDLLLSTSGLGKEELALIQERLVEKAKYERNKLRAQHEVESSEGLPLRREASSDTQTDLMFPTVRATKDWPVMNAVASSTRSASHLVNQEDAPAITSAPAVLDGEEQFSQFPTHTVPRSELPKGPPPARPPPPTTTTSQDSTVVSPGLASASSAPDSGSAPRKWIDEDPEARRDIEERIAEATTKLFRAPSRTAHKRSLSKKNIGAPVLVSSSSKVPTTPITTVDAPPVVGATKRDKDKGAASVGRKMSTRWKKGFFKKHGSNDAVAPPVPAASVSSPTKATASSPTKPAASSPTKPTASSPTKRGRRSPTPVAAHSSATTTPKASDTAAVPDAPAPTTRPSADLQRYRFPNGGTTSEPARTSDEQTAEVERTVSKRSAKAARQHIVDSTPPDEGDHIRHIPSSSDASVQRFYEAGRAVGLDDSHLSEILSQHSRSPSLGATNHTQLLTELGSPTSPVLLPSAQAAAPTHRNAPARIPSPVAEDIVTFGSPETVERHSGVVRHTLVMSNNGVDSPPTSPMRYGVGAPLSYHSSHQSPPMSPGSSISKRCNSIRRKPIQYTGADLDPVERSPKAYSHTRTMSKESDTYVLPPRQFGSASGSSYPGGRASFGSARSSAVGGLPHSGTHESFIDYYANDNRGSQGVEITEYSDGRVVWNIVNALRSNDGHARGGDGDGDSDRGSRSSVVYADSRGSMASIRSQSTNYTGSLRGSQRMDDHGGLPPPTQPWHVGPTQGLSFIRRPETRVFYTNSMDVADLIDQLSLDPANATRGRIDIRPTAAGQVEYSAMSDVVSPTSGSFDMRAMPREDPSQLAYAKQPHAQALPPPPPMPSQHLYPSQRYGHGHGQAMAHGADPASATQSPSSASFLSDTSGERTVEDRLQSLMDRLRTAPGGISIARTADTGERR